MPFTTDRQLPPNPTVRVFFTGLMILKPSSDNRTCEVFVHRSASDHHLSIEIRQKRLNKPDVVLMRHLGPLTFASSLDSNPAIYGFLVRCLTNPQGVKRYHGPTLPSGAASLVPHAFNLRTHHGGKTDVDPRGGQPSIYFNEGVFYSADVTADDVKVKLMQNGTLVMPLPPLAAIIGANIYNAEVHVTWRLTGSLVTLRLKSEPDISYEIYISNAPLYEPPPSPQFPYHDELKEYYKVLPSVPTSEQYSVEFEYPTPLTTLVSAKRDDKGSTRRPCMSVIDE